ncbi:MAG: amidohydrolase [Clostridia bacterium]|nr:amidohydrolase [Clostridia bacterium]
MSTIYCGKIITMADEGYAEALVVENGLIADVGAADEIKTKYPNSEIVALDGVLMPSFIDAHSHFTTTAVHASQAEVWDIDTPEGIRDKIREYIAEKNIQKGEWIIVNGYDHTILPGYVNPPLEFIDTICPDNPLALRHKSGHMAVYNSLALSIAGVTAETAAEDPENIELKDGKLTGCLKEGAAGRVGKFIPPATLELIYSGYKDTAKLYASYGITTVQEGNIGARNLELYKMLDKDGGVDLDIVAYIGGAVNFKKLNDAFDGTCPESKVRIGGIKMLLDGSPQLRTAWLREPYVGSNDCYKPSRTDEFVCNSFRIAAENKTQILVHCNGDAAIEQFLRCLEIAEQDHPELKELKPVIVHAQLMGRDQLDRSKSLGAIPSFFVAHCYHWGDTHLRNFGPERGNYISPVGSAIRKGLTYTFHQDCPVIMPNMLETVWCAVNRITREGVQLAEDERISVYDAFKGITINAAYQYSEDNIKGTLEKGKYADMVLLDADPFEIDPMRLRDIKILKTFKNGKCIFELDK